MHQRLKVRTFIHHHLQGSQNSTDWH